jgi:hypothetical protein
MRRLTLARAFAALGALAVASSSSELTGSRYHPLPDVAHRHLVGPFAEDPALDCAMRNMTYAFTLSLLPARAPLVDVFDALRLAIDCNMSRPSGPAMAGARAAAPAARTFGATYYVDAAVGVDDDQRSGNVSAPFATPGFAVARARTGAQPAQVLLTDASPFYLAAPLVLTSEDSGLSIAAAPSAATMPVLSAGAPLGGLTWTSLGPAPGSGVNGVPVMTICAARLAADLFFEARRLLERRRLHRVRLGLERRRGALRARVVDGDERRGRRDARGARAHGQHRAPREEALPRRRLLDVPRERERRARPERHLHPGVLLGRRQRAARLPAARGRDVQL